MNAAVEPFIEGALTFGCLVSVLAFLRFWTLSRDRLFVWFALAFACFALNWMLPLVAPAFGHHGYLALLPRLAGFLLIIAGVLDKNRRGVEGTF